MENTDKTVAEPDFVGRAEYLKTMIVTNPVLNSVFDRAPRLELEHYYIGAGCIVQNVWNRLCGFPPNRGVDDIDLVYYDPDLSPDKEREIIERAAGLFADVPIRMDVKNQARVHLWYERHFGYPIAPYASLEQAIDTWPTTATAIGLRKNSNGLWKLHAPFGLNDLFGLIVRANKVQITKEIYEKKVRRWKRDWPDLIVIPWD